VHKKDPFGLGGDGPKGVSATKDVGHVGKFGLVKVFFSSIGLHRQKNTEGLFLVDCLNLLQKILV